MSQDFAKKRRAPAKNGGKKAKPQNQRTSRSQPKAQAGSSHWKWLFTGAILGSFATFLLFLSGVISAPDIEGNPKTVSVQTAKGKTKEIPQPRFDFYQMLKESEVVVDRSASQYDGGGTRKRETMEYLLQVGSFKNSGDADGLHARLALSGFDAAVEKVKVRDGSSWHRVLVGPYTDKTKLGSNRAKLVNQGMETLVIERQAKQ